MLAGGGTHTRESDRCERREQENNGEKEDTKRTEEVTEDKRNTRTQIGDGSDGVKEGCKSVTGLTRDST